MNNKFINLALNEIYPFDISKAGDCNADLLRDTYNRLFILIDTPDKNELFTLKKGALKCGILAKNGMILLIWQFFNKKNELCLSLDSPFDARIIPDLALHDITNSKTRLSIEVHVVDSLTTKLKALRVITMPNSLTLEFMSAVQDQLASENKGEKQLKSWLSKTPDELANSIKMYTMGT